MMLNNKKICLIFGVLFICLIGCSKDDNQVPNIVIEDPDPEPEEETFNYTSSGTYNLNVVYFMPTDTPEDVVSTSHERISEILLEGREFYRKNMIANGFGDKTFNLLIDDVKKRINITYIEAKKPKSNYPYDGGANAIKNEVEAYFAQNPNKKTSDHYLIIVPVADASPGNANVPFYGLGRWCYALDYAEMRQINIEENTISKWVGGMMHELGHGLNLPHNKETVSDLSDALKGTALMGAGNGTYGKAPTFISKANCAILNSNQVFSNSPDNYYHGVNTVITSIKASYDGTGNILVSGSFTSDKVVNYASFYNNLEGGAAYDAVSFASKVTSGSNTFSISMPINEFHVTGNANYQLIIMLTHNTGEVVNFTFDYLFENNVPIIKFGDRDYTDRSSWNIVSTSEGNTTRAGYSVNNIIDSNVTTFWNSKWPYSIAQDGPHFVTLDMGASKTIKGLYIISQRSNTNYRPKHLKVEISNDGQTWTELKQFTTTSAETSSSFECVFDAPISTRYFKVIVDEVWTNTSEQNLSINEIDVIL